MSVTAFNRRRREIAKRQAEPKAAPTNSEPVQSASTEAPKRRRKTRPSANTTAEE